MESQKTPREDEIGNLAGEEAQFAEILRLGDLNKVEAFLQDRDKRKQEIKEAAKRADEEKHPWRTKFRETLNHFWGAVSEGLNMMAYGMWGALREALLPFIAVPTTWRRIHHWQCPEVYEELNGKDGILIVYVITTLAMLILIFVFFVDGVAVPAAVAWLITNFLSLSYEIGRTKIHKK